MDIDFNFLNDLASELINKNNELLKQWENTLYTNNEKEGKSNE